MWLDDLRRDAAYAARTLARTPGFAAVTVLTLALGIGATTAVFSVVNALLLKHLAYAGDSDRLVRMMAHIPAESQAARPRRVPVGVNAAEAAEVKARSRALTDVATVSPTLMALTGHEGAARLQGARVTATLFPMVRAEAILGRVFTADDSRPGADPVILLGHETWRRYFGGDPRILGRTLTMESVLGRRTSAQYTVVGVMPSTFALPNSHTQFWLPLTNSGESALMRGPVLGRLADGVFLEAALAELAPIVRAVRHHPPAYRYELVREQDELVAPVRPALLVLMGAVACVLLIACVNVANLLLARAAARSRETAVRTALGAGRSRLVRQALTESGILALLGGAAGVALAIGGIRLLRYLGTTPFRLDLATSATGAVLPRLDEVGIDGAVLGFTAVTAIATGMLFGMAPALRQSRSDAMDVLRRAAGTSASGFGGRGRLGARSVLVVAEIALAMVLLVGGGLLAHSFVRLVSVDPGYDADNVLTFQVALPVSAYPDARVKAFAGELIARLRTVPGIRSAGYANQLPMVQLRDSFGGLWRTPDANRRSAPGAPDARLVSREYLGAMGIRIVTGRGFEERDGADRPGVLLVNETLARRDFDGNAVGQIVYVGRHPSPFEIVGVVEDVRQFGLDREPEPQIFLDVRQWQGGPLFPVGAYYAARTDGDPDALVSSLRGIVRSLEPRAALFNVAPMADIVTTTVARPRMYAVLLGIFAAIGVVLAAIGIYGVMAYTVTQRTREIGIRMALGARRSDLMSLVVRAGAVLAAAGIGIGAVGAAWMSRYLEGMLFGVTPLDRATFAAVALVFAAVAAAAAYVPARRAARVDPLVALRCE